MQSCVEDYDHTTPELTHRWPITHLLCNKNKVSQ